MDNNKICLLINNNQIIINSLVSTQQEAFVEVAKLAAQTGVVDDYHHLVKGLEEREQEASTGMEDGFAIPHARIDAIKKPAIFLAKYQKPIEWKSYDKKPIRIAIFLFIPKKQSSSTHLLVLSKIAQKLLDQEFKNKLIQADSAQEIVDLFNNEINFSVDQQEEKTDMTKVTPIADSETGYVIAITGCPAGVAHTYMAAKAIEDFAKSKNWRVKVEKQGANGIEDKITEEDVKNANFAIIAADINPEGLERLKGLPQIKVPVAEPIYEMAKLWDKALGIKENKDNQAFLNLNNTESKSEKNKFSFKIHLKKETKSLKDAVLTGISFAVPVIVAGTTVAAITTIINQIWGASVIKANAQWINTLGDVAGSVLSVLLAPILSAYIANAMADKPGLAVGFVSGLGCNAVVLYEAGNGITQPVTGLGFLGGLISGILSGYLMRFARAYVRSKKIQGVLTWFIYPVFGSLIMLLFILFVIGHPIALLINVIFGGLSVVQKSEGGFAIGILMGMLCVVDMGGPFNKLAWAFSIVSFTQAFQGGQGGKLVNPELLIPYGSFWAAGIGTGWTTSIVTLINRKHAEQGERETAKISWILSSLGISEGSIPFILTDPLRVIPCFMVGGAVSGGISAYLHLGSTIVGGGFITMAGIQSTNGSMALWLAIVLWLITAIIGCLISTGLILFLKLLKQNPILNMKFRYWTLLILSFGTYKYVIKSDIK